MGENVPLIDELQSALADVGVGGLSVTREELEKWSPLELSVAHDWALRERLHRDGKRVQHRPKPRGIQRLQDEYWMRLRKSSPIDFAATSQMSEEPRRG